MRRLLTAAALLAAALGPVAVSADAATAPPPPPPRATLVDQLCHQALDPLARVLSVTAVMRPLPGTAQMAVKFRLFQRSGNGGFRAVTGNGLGVWIVPSVPTLGQRPDDVWHIVHPVADLKAPAWYRLQVQFRWTGPDGQVLGIAVRTSHTCYQPDLRPDLVIRRIAVRPDQRFPRARDDYLVQIANTGATAANGIDVQFDDGVSLQQHTILHLGGNGTVQLVFVGAACDAGDPPSVTIDPRHELDVASRARASRVVRCPAP